MFQFKSITVIFFLTLFVSGCATSLDQSSNEFRTQVDIELCKDYFKDNDLFASQDFASLNVNRKQYLVRLLDQMNRRGLSREQCQYIMDNMP